MYSLLFSSLYQYFLEVLGALVLHIRESGKFRGIETLRHSPQWIDSGSGGEISQPPVLEMNSHENQFVFLTEVLIELTTQWLHQHSQSSALFCLSPFLSHALCFLTLALWYHLPNKLALSQSMS